MNILDWIVIYCGGRLVYRRIFRSVSNLIHYVPGTPPPTVSTTRSAKIFPGEQNCLWLRATERAKEDKISVYQGLG